MKARHAYLLAVIATRLDKDEPCDYLVLTASIYAGIIARSSTMCLLPFWGNFLRAVTRHRDRFKGDLNQSQICKAVKANEVAWGDIDRALEALGPSNAVSVPNSAGANDRMAGRRPLSCADDRDPSLGERRESGGRSRDRGESPSRECRLSYLNDLCAATQGSGILEIVIDPPPST